jgi:hypothetical protein
MSSIFNEIRRPTYNQIMKIYYIKTLQYRLGKFKRLPNIDYNIDENILNLCKKYLPRDSNYESKHLLQEVSIISNLKKIVKTGENNLILDVGGGNGCLAYLCSKILDTLTIVIDRHKPARCVDNFKLDLSKYSRITIDLKDFDISKYSNYNIYIIAKHLCGTSLDIVLKYIKFNNVKGFVVAPCCYHKGDYNELYNNYLSKDEWLLLSKISEYKSYKMLPTPYYNLGYNSEILLNNIRIDYLKDHYNIEFLEYVDIKVTPKNQLLVGYVNVF